MEDDKGKEIAVVGETTPTTAASVEVLNKDQQNDDTKSTATAATKEGDTQKVGEKGEREEPKCTKEDLIELIRAVKFSNPDASIRHVHNEIQNNMAKNESFEFLENIKLNDVKKVWKKAITGGSSGNTVSNSANNTSAASSSTKSKNSHGNTNANDINKNSILSEVDMKKSKDGILKFYTVGDGSVKTLAKNYTIQAANAAIAASKDVDEDDDNESNLKKYVNCFLDVPADCSGGRPHQALINFNDNKKKKSRKGAGDGREIVKIQVAAPFPGMGNTPMLLYNIDRTARTFIHDDDNDDNRGYEKIKQMINAHGVSGALKSGGTKAYFYSRITRREGEQQDLISIDISELAPAQKW
mmetsp:Transcript_15069/g.22783  ORF Transcript_15069/g.22783 Transcript_15069/m.22783 type:complete len:356 (-) Transcript_15069:1970-3037(-)